jgi:hypothetical protein
VRHGFTLHVRGGGGGGFDSSGAGTASSALSSQMPGGANAGMQGSGASSASASGGAAARTWRRVAIAVGGGAPSGDSSGALREDGSVLSMQLVTTALATIVYRLMDDDSESVPGRVQSAAQRHPLARVSPPPLFRVPEAPAPAHHLHLPSFSSPILSQPSPSAFQRCPSGALRLSSRASCSGSHDPRASSSSSACWIWRSGGQRGRGGRERAEGAVWVDGRRCICSCSCATPLMLT